MNNALSIKLPVITLSNLAIGIKNSLSSYYINNRLVIVRLVNVKDIQDSKINVKKADLVKVKEQMHWKGIASKPVILSLPLQTRNLKQQWLVKTLMVLLSALISYL